MASLGLVGGAVAASGATTPAPDTGSATSTITLPALTITDASGVAHVVSLGAITSNASTDLLLASLGLADGNVLGSALPGWTASTSGGSQSGDHSVPVSSSMANGGVTLAGYEVAAGTGAAHSTLGALTGSLAASAFGTSVSLGQNGLSTSSDSTGSHGTLAVHVVGANIHLGDLLPTDVLDALPLSQLLTFAQGLQLGIPSDVTTTVTQLTNLTTLLNQLQTTASGLTAAQAQLAGLLQNIPGTQAAQQALDAAEQQLATALSQLSGAQQQLAQDQAAAQSLQNQVAAATNSVASAQSALAAANAAVANLVAQLAANPLSLLLQQQLTAAQATAAQAQTQLSAAQGALAALQQQLASATAQVATDQQTVNTLQQAVSSAQSTVTAAQATLDAQTAAVAASNQAVTTAQAAVNSLLTTLTTQLTSISNAVSALPDLQSVRSELLGIVTAAPLVDTGAVTSTVDADADQAGGTGAVSCTIANVSVLGSPVLGSALPGATCDAVRSGFNAAVSALHTALARLPGAGAVPTPTLDGLTATTTGAPAAAGDAVSAASAALAPLHVALPGLSLHAVTDALVASLTSTLSQLSTSLSGLGVPAASAALTSTLGPLSATVAALPTGAALSGLRTLGVDLSLAGLSATAAHNRSLVGTPGSGTGTPSTTPSSTATSSTPTPTAAPASVTPTPTATSTAVSGPGAAGEPGDRPPDHVTRPDRQLPFSGSDAAADIAVAMLALLAGAHLTVLGRRRRRAAAI